jgi:hypothetical protein
MSAATAKNRSHALEMLLLYSPVLIAILVMIPRLLSPQFGLLDDGRGLVTLDKFINHGVWDMSVDIMEGRYRPLYWLWFGLFYKLAGDNPFWFFFGNMCALVSAVAGLIFLVFKATLSRRAAFLSGLFLALASPVIESYYTLSKGETLQAAMLVLSLVVISFFNSELKPATKVFLVALSVITLLLAHTSKETSIVVLPIAFIWFLTARFLVRGSENSRGRVVRAAYLISAFISVIVYYVLRIYFVTWQMNTGTYTSRYGLGLSQLVASGIRWAGWLVRDYAHLSPLIAAGIIVWVLRRKISHGHILIDSLVWMGIWIAVFLPWYFMAEYYMMPFAIGAAVFGGILADNVFEFAHNEKRGWRWAAIVALGLSALLFFSSQVNDLSNGRIQLAVDSANADLLSFLQNTEPNSTILLNIQTPNEYYYKLIDYLNHYWSRSDLTISTFDFQDTSSPGIYYLIAPYVMNQPLLAVRQGIVEDTQSKWNESLIPYFQEHPGWQIVQQFERHFSLSGMDLPRLFCPLIKTRAFCASPAPLLDLRPFTYGWIIYRMEKP